jgi:excisionase family DNA binding protein
MMTDIPMTTIQAASYLGLSKSTTEKLRHFGGGPKYLKLGHAVRYRQQDLDAWLDERLIENTSQRPSRA